mmetsp:Transcript_77153/g.136672  ORF Transcript_77153/g.136672 Transcript_77153/m.136672 type:complete len:503 (-) Transcript_77153:70-1578(-)
MMQETALPKNALIAMPVPGLSKARTTGMHAMNLGVLCMTALIEGADIQLLPASFRALEAELGFAPSSLALLTLLQGCMGACCGPFWGSLADNGFSRRILLATGAAGWGILTIALACATSFATIAVLRMLNGIMLGMILPVMQSFVADMASGSDLGFMFGCLQFYTNFGQVFGAVTVTTMSNRVFYGVQGWRWAFTGVGISSFAISGFVLMALKEEPRQWTPEHVGVRTELVKFLGFLKVRSFLVIVIQGMFGMIPWAGMAFATMYFQYLGLSDTAASTVYGMSIIGTALGGIVGGIAGDRLAAWSPSHGRVFTAQITAGLGIPFVLAIFLSSPDKTTPVVYALLCFGLGLCSSWASSGCNRPIFTEIVPPGSRASAMAWEVTLESTCGFLLGPAAVGMLAEHAFGYKMNRLQVSEMSPVARMANAKALGQGLVIITVVPWILCLLSYTFLHFTLAADRAGARKKATSQLEGNALQPPATEATPLASSVCRSQAEGVMQSGAA